MKAKLEAMIKLRQATKEWRKGVQGYEWLTKTEMEEKKWHQCHGLPDQVNQFHIGAQLS